jgi:hypothetical protein
MNTDGEAIEAALETGRQALDAWKFEPDNWNHGIVCEVTLTLSQLYPLDLKTFIHQHMRYKLGKTHERVGLELLPERVEMKTRRDTARMFRTAIVRFKVQ